MKLRREPSEMMRIKLYPPEIAYDKMSVVEEEYHNLSMSSNRIITSKDIRIRNPPTLEQNIVHIEINYVNNPNSFWINYLGSENNGACGNQLAQLDTEIEKIMKSKKDLKSISAKSVEVDQLYLAPYEGIYYRARIESVIHSEKSAKVFFVDYGNVEVVNISKLFVINQELTAKYRFLIETPALAHECSLSFTKPNRHRKFDGTWDNYSVTKFKDLIESDNYQEPITFVGKVSSVVPNASIKSEHLIHITLFKKVNNVSIRDQGNCDYKYSINYQFQCLKDKLGNHLAVYTAESYMSQLNRQLRESHDSFNAIEKAEREKSQLNFLGANRAYKTHDSNLSSSILKQRGHFDQRTLAVQLKGPYHPLQFNVTATTRIGSCKKANVETDSVNSVLIDKSPKDRHDSWLVAGHVGTNPAGTALVLRSTTVMPNIKGLGALLAMTFSPKVEMRYDSKIQKYTGCLLGLGCRKKHESSQSQLTSSSRTPEDDEDWNYSLNDSDKYVPYQPEHDMELQFDVNVDNDDINLINQLRYRISILLLELIKEETT